MCESLQKQEEQPPGSGSWVWVPETAASKVDFEVFSRTV